MTRISAFLATGADRGTAGGGFATAVDALGCASVPVADEEGGGWRDAANNEGGDALAGAGAVDVPLDEALGAGRPKDSVDCLYFDDDEVDDLEESDLSPDLDGAIAGAARIVGDLDLPLAEADVEACGGSENGLRVEGEARVGEREAAAEGGVGRFQTDAGSTPERAGAATTDAAGGSAAVGGTDVAGGLFAASACRCFSNSRARFSFRSRFASSRSLTCLCASASESCDPPASGCALAGPLSPCAVARSLGGAGWACETDGAFFACEPEDEAIGCGRLTTEEFAARGCWRSCWRSDSMRCVAWRRREAGREAKSVPPPS